MFSIAAAFMNVDTDTQWAYMEGFQNYFEAKKDYLKTQHPRDFLSSSSSKDEGPRQTAERGPSPTRACLAVIAHLNALLSALVGRSNRQILDVFYGEIGLRIHTLLCKHLKQVTVSVPGSVQLQANLRQYVQTLDSLGPDNAALAQALTALVRVAERQHTSSSCGQGHCTVCWPACRRRADHFGAVGPLPVCLEGGQLAWYQQ
ncbi:hypothetical protein PTTG_26974 [Puccinia triticina 1-1 BBBD Race 1]|uniref:Exocyst complex component Sec10-like alpha-helical bundle domain-containing protein n=1 Tax=Puccinia triticina (isolate 1-1 / race 1 (BBBD)) TaxID=630390 RepID=A0A180GPZ0_PUCT1|nr:hypothetical protein PTTG_26974 [Puccinia triticina 1-1 BBBD Race 1]